MTMCGLFGTTIKISNVNIEKIKATLINRGPDGEGMFTDSNVTLLHTRLSIVDLNGGSQPFYNEENSMICIVNGEIYNYARIKKELIQLGHQFNTKNDCEVILHLYEEKGTDGFKELEGIFAFAIYEKGKKIILGRDPVGVKPLYYWWQGNTLVFSSLIKTLLKHPSVQTSLNTLTLFEHEILDYWTEYKTLFKGINEVKPGRIMEFTLTPYLQVMEKIYLNLFEDQELFLMDREAAIERLCQLLEEAVVLNLMGDVSTGTLLSGGLDSTILTCLFARERYDSVMTIGVPDSPDWQSAHYVSSCLGLTHYTYQITPERYLQDLPSIVRASESFLKGAPIYYAALLAKGRHKVLLCGEGADELFAGYSLYADPGALLERMNYKAKVLLDSEVDKEIKEYMNQILGQHNSLRNPKILTEHILRQWLQYQLNIKHLIPFDHLSMENGVEVRVPYLFTKLVRFATSLPLHYKLGPEQKWILRQASARICPPVIHDMVNSRSKIGFPYTIFRYVEPKINQMLEEKLPDNYVKKHPFAKCFYKREKSSLFYFDMFYHIFFNKNGDISGDEVKEILEGDIY